MIDLFFFSRLESHYSYSFKSARWPFFVGMS